MLPRENAETIYRSKFKIFLHFQCSKTPTFSFEVPALGPMYAVMEHPYLRVDC